MGRRYLSKLQRNAVGCSSEGSALWKHVEELRVFTLWLHSRDQDLFNRPHSLKDGFCCSFPALHSCGHATHKEGREGLITCHIEALDRCAYQFFRLIITKIFIIPCPSSYRC